VRRQGDRVAAIYCVAYVCFWHKADIAAALIMSAFGGKADIEAKLLSRDEARRIAANIAECPSY
jgi:hypothetical protein